MFTKKAILVAALTLISSISFQNALAYDGFGNVTVKSAKTDVVLACDIRSNPVPGSSALVIHVAKGKDTTANLWNPILKANPDIMKENPPLIYCALDLDDEVDSYPRIANFQFNPVQPNLGISGFVFGLYQYSSAVIPDTTFYLPSTNLRTPNIFISTKYKPST